MSETPGRFTKPLAVLRNLQDLALLLVFFVSASMATYWSAVDWVWGQVKLIQWLIAAAVILVLWIICLVLFFARFLRHKAFRARGWRPVAYRLFLILGIIGIPSAIGGAFAASYVWAWHAHSRTTIAVADFDGDSGKLRFTDILINGLESRMHDDDRVRVIRLNKVIREGEVHDVAKLAARGKGADIVIWGWHGSDKNGDIISVKMMLLPRLSATFKRKPEAGWFTTVLPSATELDIDAVFISSSHDTYPFKLQTYVTDRITYQAAFVEGLVRYAYREWDAADKSFTQALESLDCFITNKDGITSPSWKKDQEDLADEAKAIVHLFRGIARLKNVKVYKTSQHSLTAAVEQYTDAIRANPDLGVAYYQRGVARAKLHELSAAMADFTSAVALSLSSAGMEEFERYYLHGQLFLDQDMLDNALEASSLALDNIPPRNHRERARHLTIQGIALRRQEHLRNSIKVLKRALHEFREAGDDGDPESEAFANRNLGEALKRLDPRKNLGPAVEQFKKARELWEQLAELAPPDTHVYYKYRNEIAGEDSRIGDAYRDAFKSSDTPKDDEGMLDKAINAYKKALEIRDPLLKAKFATVDATGHWASTHGNLGIARYQKAVIKSKAKTWIQENVIEELDMAVGAYEKLVDVAEQDKKATPDMIAKARSFRDDRAYFRMYRAMAYSLSDQAKKARADFEKAEETLTNLVDTESQYQFADTLAECLMGFSTFLQQQARDAKDAIEFTRLRNLSFDKTSQSLTRYAEFVGPGGRTWLYDDMQKAYDTLYNLIDNRSKQGDGTPTPPAAEDQRRLLVAASRVQGTKLFLLSKSSDDPGDDHSPEVVTKLKQELQDVVKKLQEVLRRVSPGTSTADTP